MKPKRLNVRLPEDVHRKLRLVLIGKDTTLQEWAVKAAKKEIGEK